MSELPEGWESVSIESLLSHSIGGVWGSLQGVEEVDVKVLRVTEFGRWGRLRPETGVTRSISAMQFSSRCLQNGDLLLEKSGGGPSQPVGRVVQFRGGLDRSAVPTNFVQLLRPDIAKVDPRYLLYALCWNHVSGVVVQYQRATTNIRNLQTKEYLQSHLPVPPIPEQRRIVEVIEEQFSRLDAGVESLQRAKRNLTRLRVSTLRAAMSGNLVVPNSTTEWRTLQFGELVENHDSVRVPIKAQDREVRGGQYPYYGAQGIIDTIDEYLFDGDYLLVAEDGANLLSRSKPLAFLVSGRFWVNNHAHVVKPHPGIRREFLAFALNAMDISRFVSGSAQPKLTQANLNRLQISLPAEHEQARIIDEVERQFSIVEAMAKTIDAGLARAGTLRQSILSQAFSGKLTGAA